MQSKQRDVRNPLRTIWGSVSGAGAVVNAGSADWTCTRLSAGVYVFKFTPVFKGKPGVTIGQVTWNVFPNVVQSDADQVRIEQYAGAAQTDAAFNFRFEGRA